MKFKKKLLLLLEAYLEEDVNETFRDGRNHEMEGACHQLTTDIHFRLLCEQEINSCWVCDIIIFLAYLFPQPTLHRKYRKKYFGLGP